MTDFIAVSKGLWMICFYIREFTVWVDEQPYLSAAADRGLRTQTEKEDKHWNEHQADAGETFPWCESNNESTFNEFLQLSMV